MKRIVCLGILLILLIPVIVNAEECDNGKVYIDSISVEKATGVEEIEAVSAQGKTIDLALKMSNVGDNIRYKITIKNDSSEDYVLDKNSINAKSKYIDYIVESDNSTIIKAKSSKTIYLRVNYSHQVPADAFENGTINDDINMKVNLSTNENILNPNTGVKYILFVSLVVLVMISLLIIFKNKRLSKVLLLIISISMFIPITTYALCRCDISINSTVMILEEPFSGTVYRFDEKIFRVGDRTKHMGWFVYEKEKNEPFDLFESKEECNNEINNAISNGYINEGEVYCKYNSISTIDDYKLDPSLLNTNFYIKDEIKSDIVTKTELCFVTDKEICFLPDESAYEENLNKLRNEEEWFNNNGGSCNFTSPNSFCSGAGFNRVNVGHYYFETMVSRDDGYYCNSITCNYPET